MNNPMDFLKLFMGSGGNPQQLLLKAMNITGNNNTVIKNLIDMANSGNSTGVENFARNLLKEKGIDFDKEFSNFMNTINKR